MSCRRRRGDEQALGRELYRDRSPRRSFRPASRRMLRGLSRAAASPAGAFADFVQHHDGEALTSCVDAATPVGEMA